jgi:hypothetical protein
MLTPLVTEISRLSSHHRRVAYVMLGAGHPMEAHRADSRAMFARGQSADAGEGVTSFLEKRPAAFPDRVSDGLPAVFGP